MTVLVGIVIGAPIGWLAHKYWKKIADMFSPAPKV